jgi:ankyrin repeat protein
LNDFVKFLADHGADLQAKDANGRTPLDLAKGTGTAGRGQAESFPETVKLLESLIAARGTAQSPAR